MTQVVSAFYWRQNIRPSAPVRRRRGQSLEALAARIRELRRSGLTQAAVAEQLGVTKRYVQKIEQRGRHAVT